MLKYLINGPSPVQYDTDKNGIIDFKEFLGLCMDLNTNESEKAVAKLFQSVDKNGDRLAIRFLNFQYSTVLVEKLKCLFSN